MTEPRSPIVSTGTTLDRPHAVNRIPALARLLRPVQWTKNAVVLAGVVFAGKLGDPGAIGSAFVAMMAFCLASSAVYVFNDWHDQDEDRAHPTKRRRPIAAGDVSNGAALVVALVLVAGAIIPGFLISPAVAAIVAGYIILMIVYTVFWRNLPILDILVIAIGFIFRAFAGAEAVDVPLSPWLFACTLLLALTLGLGKRRHELTMVGDAFEHRRPSLPGYASLDLDRLIIAAAILTMLTYGAYGIAVPDAGRALSMIVTVPFVTISLSRYLFLVLKRGLGGSPEKMLLTDRPLFAGIALWGVAVILVVLS